MDIRSLLLAIAEVIADEAEKNQAFKTALENVLLGNIKTSLGSEKPQTGENDVLNELRKWFDEGREVLLKNLNNKKFKKDDLIKIGSNLGIAIGKKDNKADITEKIADKMKELSAEKDAGKLENETEIDKAEIEEPAVEESEITEPVIIESFDGNSGLDISHSTDSPEADSLDQIADMPLPDKPDELSEKASTILRTEESEKISASLQAEEASDAKKPETDETPEIFNPIAVYLHEGQAILKEKLEVLDLKDLRKIIREYGLDKTRKSLNWKDKNRVIEKILERSKARATKGNSYLSYDK